MSSAQILVGLRSWWGSRSLSVRRRRFATLGLSSATEAIARACVEILLPRFRLHGVEGSHTASFIAPLVELGKAIRLTLRMMP